MSDEQTADRIERETVIGAPLARVWRALSDSVEFGRWFGAEFDGAFAPGAALRGRITHPGHEHMTFDLWIERVEPERRLAFRWHPSAIDPERDYSAEPTTRVEIELDAVAEGTRVRLSESGFDALPADRRAAARHMESQGWTHQLGNVAKHVGGAKEQD